MVLIDSMHEGIGRDSKCQRLQRLRSYHFLKYTNAAFESLFDQAATGSARRVKAPVVLAFELEMLRIIRLSSSDRSY